MKTFVEWNQSGKSFDQFVNPMDEVDHQIVDYFKTIATPASMMGDLLQCGEVSAVIAGKVLYPTFIKIADKWHFKGNLPRLLWSVRTPSEVTI